MSPLNKSYFASFSDRETLVVIIFFRNLDSTDLGQDDHVSRVHLSLQKFFIVDKLAENKCLLFCEWESHNSSVGYFFLHI